MSIHIQIERFEGPLALLLHLIRQEEMDIFDINIHQITRQYLDYIKAMKQLDLEVAGEFVAMAATLIHIKSRMLLPQYNEEGEVVEIEDPRKELVQKLLEYQKFKEASQQLYQRPLLGRDIWLRGQRLDLTAPQEGEIIVEEENALFALISAYRTVIRNIKKGIHRVAAELQSIASRVAEIKDRLVVGQRILFSQLIDATENRSNQVLVTFLSLLELAKLGFVSLFQSENFAEIHIEAKQTVTADAISRVEDYDTGVQQAEQAAQTMMNEAWLTPSSDEEEESGPMAKSESVANEEGLTEQAATDEEILAEEIKLDLVDKPLLGSLT